MTNGEMKHRHGLNLPLWSAAAGLLLVPAIAMQFDTGVRWGPFDFVVMGVLLAAAAGAYEFLSRIGRGAYRAAAALAILGAFLLVWINLAVGVIGDEGNRANLMYAGLLAILVGGAAVSRLAARNMARTMLAVAGAQVAVGVMALATRAGLGDPSWPWDVIGVSAMFTGLWLASAWLFGRAVQPTVAA